MFVFQSRRVLYHIRNSKGHGKRLIQSSSISKEKNSFVCPGTLHLVSTPIGCISDISQRALTVLKNADIVLCEDTRTTGFLLTQFGINRELLSFNQENEYRRLPSIISQLHEGKSVALVSDAGTPLLSDPGSPLVKVCLEQNIPVTPIPGANAAISALICSGFYSTPFSFYGFISRSGKGRSVLLEEIAANKYTSILFESSHRVASTLSELSSYFEADRRVCICRELTKMHESILHTTVGEIVKEELILKGEFTLVIEGMKEYVDRSSRTDIAPDPKAIKCINLLKQEGISHDVIQNVVKNVFNVFLPL